MLKQTISTHGQHLKRKWFYIWDANNLQALWRLESILWGYTEKNKGSKRLFFYGDAIENHFGFLPWDKKIKKVIASFYLSIMIFFSQFWKNFVSSQIWVYVSQFWLFSHSSEKRLTLFCFLHWIKKVTATSHNSDFFSSQFWIFIFWKYWIVRKKSEL